MTISVNTLLAPASASRLLSIGLQIAAALQLPVTSWRVDDPARVLLKFAANALAVWEGGVATEFIRSAWLSTARGDWLTLLASEVYGVERTLATYATATVVLDNTAGGGTYVIGAGDVTLKNTATGATYRSTGATATLLPGASLSVEVVADAPGSDGSAGADEIDDFVTPLLGVTIASSTAAVGVDEQSDDSLVAACRASLGARSPNGPADAYRYVVTNPDLTGVDDITRATVASDSTTGVVTVYVAGAAGEALAGSVAAAQSAVDTWAAPLCVTATVANATEQGIDVTATLAGSGVPASYEADAESRINALLSAVPIGGVVAKSAITATLHEYLVESGVDSPSVSVATPAADTTLGAGVVPVPGAYSIGV